MEEKLYHVRRYRPAFFSGFDNAVVRDVPHDKIIEAPWLEGFKHHDFERFTLTPYPEYDPKELIIEAHYTSGEHWVCGFAVETTHEFAKNWRYEPHQS